MANENNPEYKLINSMEGCGIDDTSSLFRDWEHKPNSQALELVSNRSEFFGDSKDKPYSKK